MHTSLINLAALLIAAVSVAGLAPSFIWQIGCLSLLVAVVGVPHGALDHWVGRDLLEHDLKHFWLPVFLLGYLAVAALVVIGWYTLPTLTVLSFLLASSWHFGVEEEEQPLDTMWSHWVSIARGGMVIWVPAISQPVALKTTLAMVLPHASVWTASMAVSAAAFSGLIFAPALLVDCILRGWRTLSICRTLCFAAMFAFAGPLLSFTVYFCGWHSIIGLRKLRMLHGGGFSSFVLRLLPLTGLTALGALVAFWFLTRTETLPTALIRTTFIGLSAIAVPHLLLHIAANMISYKRLSPREGDLLNGVIT